MTGAFSFKQGPFYINVILRDLNQTHHKTCGMNLCDLCDFISGKRLILSKSCHRTPTAFTRSLFLKTCVLKHC